MAAPNIEPMGIDSPVSEFPKVFVRDDSRPIDKLRPNTKEHADVLDYLVKRIELSERKMCQFYPRWQVNEKKVQAYIDLPKWDQVLKEMNDKGKPPSSVPVIVPTCHAIVSTIVTFLLHTFAGRRPIFQLGHLADEHMEKARNMEMVLQYQADRSRMIRHLYQTFWDGMVYGVSFMRVRWLIERAMRTRMTTQQGTDFLGIPLPA